TFHKHVGELCRGFQLHTDFTDYQHELFRPYRLVACLLKSLRQLCPEYDLWRHHEYEYETGRVPIDVINGGSFLRRWVDDDSSDANALIEKLNWTAADWQQRRQPYLLY
ncbi:MAG: DUF1343 domain-containing protein, partial [Gammaproteobacteria bacterium]|nr:DUF1343 domain-containing protein [Gammaproteobacteria bacterium]